MPPHKLYLKRTTYSDKSTIGELSLDNKSLCLTLEDTIRKLKVPGETAIPLGTYKVALAFSNRYKRHMPYILDVPDFTGIMIHVGNTDKHTQGCVLVGRTQMKDFIGHSQETFDNIYPKIEAAIRDTGLLITIV